MRFSFLVFLFTLSANALATSSAAQTCTFALAEKRPIEFKNVEVFRRNNNVGQQQVGDLTFEQWFSVGPFAENVENFIGLTKDGHIYHLVKWNNRTVARLLSGHRIFKEIYLRDGRILSAENEKKQILFYSPSAWLTSPKKAVLKHGFLSAVGSAAAISAISFVYPDFLTMDYAQLVAGSGIGLQTFLLMLVRYDYLNTFPDGFVETPHLIGRDLALTDWTPPQQDELTPPVPAYATEDVRKP